MRRAFTLIEIVVIVAIVAVLIGVVLITFGRMRIKTPGLTDTMQLRGIQQSLVVWCNSNNGDYPLPSEIDGADLTVTEKGRAKDTTANIFSILIFNGNIPPELCISPVEANTGSIQRDEDYEYFNPRAAIDPASALWDPGFSADFTGGQIGNISYGHLQPSGTRSWNAAPTGRLKLWADTFSTTEAVLGNRGPEIASVSVTGDPGVATNYSVSMPLASSMTLLIHGPRTSWEGFISFNDGHVEEVRTLGPITPAGASAPISYATATSRRLDTLFFDEPDDVNGSNMFLGIFTTAGEKPSDFKGIWD